MEWMAVPLVFLAIGFIIHGWPDIKIGGRHNYYYNQKEEED